MKLSDKCELMQGTNTMRRQIFQNYRKFTKTLDSKKWSITLYIISLLNGSFFENWNKHWVAPTRTHWAETAWMVCSKSFPTSIVDFRMNVMNKQRIFRISSRLVQKKDWRKKTLNSKNCLMILGQTGTVQVLVTRVS